MLVCTAGLLAICFNVPPLDAAWTVVQSASYLCCFVLLSYLVVVVVHFASRHVLQSWRGSAHDTDTTLTSTPAVAAAVTAPAASPSGRIAAAAAVTAPAASPSGRISAALRARVTGLCSRSVAVAVRTAVGVLAAVAVAVLVQLVRSEPPGVPSALPVAIAVWLLRLLAALVVFGGAVWLRRSRGVPPLPHSAAVGVTAVVLTLVVIQVCV